MTRAVSDAVMGALAEARALGFLGPGPLEEHVGSAERFAAALDGAASEDARALDLGSGGGVPGLVLAEWFPRWRWVLFDAHRRRTSFLAAAVARLELVGRVSVVRGRAEEAGHDAAFRERFDVVTSRSFGPPAATAEAACGFLRVNGVLVVAEPPGGAERWDEAGLGRVALRRATGSPGAVVLEKVGALSAQYPRPVQRQRRSPLF